ncbi:MULTISPECIES: UDP-glucose 4-epimerase GalE [unclassified Bradyrhizobium]|uniref:UDP-glucose 4-epimerase GalE n=1 Tax=unclassified Bradyrhizobium TaxID=2631580 RepID=UPI002916C5C7|nr:MULTISPECIES: UDP-glucose 4-epimerase GalE [unclassified Bradyrhizobium]
MAVLITGGLGFIGSHACIALLQAGYEIVVVDDLSNSEGDILDRIEAVAHRRPAFACVSLLDGTSLASVFKKNDVTAVIHLAAFKAVSGSLRDPLSYYENNVSGTLSLLERMREANVKSLVFSSSATVYGVPASLPIGEDFPRVASNPYGRSKVMIEDILTDLVMSDGSWSVVNLRYFNPVGAHESGMLGERARNRPTSLMPHLLQVAAGQRKSVRVFGGDYPTRDGSCVRDFIHVVDLAEGHVAALQYLNRYSGISSFNLGVGRGVSVFELCDAFERSTGQPIRRQIVGRRPGDVAECWADVSKAQRVLQWKANRDVDAMCRDAWRWKRQLLNTSLDDVAG